jgi:hypothetical protein
LSAQGFRLEKQFDLAPGNRFELRSELGSVTVRGVEGQRASVLVTSDRDDVDRRFGIRFEQPAGRLVMTVVHKGGRLGGWFGNSERPVSPSTCRREPLSIWMLPAVASSCPASRRLSAPGAREAP